jgi:photosystem II stability/assembly factor-like uncharacterized protein
MASTKARTPKVPQAPQRKQAGTRPERRWLPLAVGAAVVLVAVAALAVARGNSSGDGKTGGLPHTSDYHSLLVAPTNPRQLLLGTHQGLFRSTDAGRHWASYRMGGRDAMNLVRPAGGSTVWLAGHDVFARSDDGGKTWRTLAPTTLPSLDLHGFTVDPHSPSMLYAAVAGVGLYRSTNGGRSFSEVSKDVGGMVMALAVTPGDDILAGDMQRGLLVSHDKGATWKLLLKAQLAGLAINPKNPQTILATGPGILRSTDGGKTWSVVAPIGAGAGPVAWSRSDPRLAYVVGFDRILYRSGDGGATWTPVR